MIEVIPKEEITCQDDTVYRQAALDAIGEQPLVWTDDDDFAQGKATQWEYDIDAIKALPPAQSEPQWIPWWIPCDKRLPKGQELVNVSCHDDSGDTAYDYSSCGWVTPDGEYWIVDNEINSFVVAWMPLPKPYKGETEWMT